MAVEVLASPVVHGGCYGVGVSGCHLNVSERDACVEGGHDERRSQHVRVTQAESCPLADGSDPAMRGAPVETLAVVAQQDGAFSPFADGEVDGSGGAGHEWDQGRFVALADDPQDPVPSFEGHFFDVGLTRLGDPQAIQPQKYGQGGVGVIEPLGGEEESAQLATVQSAPLRKVHDWAANVLGRVRVDATVDVSEPVEAARGRSPMVEAASLRCSMEVRYSSRWVRVASTTAKL